jgi:glycosyltransferase involved in cell wall biosynthesis
MENHIETVDAVERHGHRNGSAQVFVPMKHHDGERLLQHRPRVTKEADRHAPPLTLSVVIPTWNEAANIGPVLKQLVRFDDIVIVDAFSDDGTVEVARQVRPDLTLVERPPAGKGDALRAGFEAATGDVIVIMDADGSMDVREIDVFMSMIAVGFDLVKGSRHAVGGGSHDLTVIRSLGNRALCGLANTLFHTSWTDLCYGYLAFRRDCLPRLALAADGFEIESQILAHAALAGLRIAEIPSIEMPRLTGESHLNARRDGARILRTMLAARFSPRARRSAAALRPLSVTRGFDVEEPDFGVASTRVV